MPGSFAISTASASRISVPSNSRYAFGYGDFTIECWFRNITYPSFVTFLFSWNQSTPNSGPTSIIRRNGTQQNAYASLYENNNTSIITEILPGTWTNLQPNTWYHYAATRSGDTAYNLFVNGQKQNNADVIHPSKNYTQNGITLGNEAAGGSAMNGYITNFRVSDTVRYTTNFTPSTVPLTSDANTLLLLLANSDDYLKDSSSYNQTGITASSAVWSSLTPF